MFKSTTFKRSLIAAACTTGLLLSGSASAVNWLMLQGVEGKKAPDHRLFAFIQPAYDASVGGDKLQGLVNPATGVAFPQGVANGQHAVPNTITPEFNETSEIYMRRARVGMRGRFSGPWKNSFTSKINYFVMVALDDGLFNQNQFSTDRRPLTIDHASLTFNHIPGARIRVGLFKNPVADEVFQGVATIEFIQFTSFNATQVLENFYAGNARAPGSTTGASGTAQYSAYGFSAVRDWGVQVFDSFKVANKSWDLSYAIKVGRGEAISRGNDSNGDNELYLYASAEQNLKGGRGPRKNGIKYYAWHQSGDREFYTDATNESFDRTRYGIGVKALGKFFGSKYKHRFGAELAYAKGMIFMGPAAGVARGNATAGPGSVSFASDEDNKSRAFQIEYAFYLNKNWQFDIRWAREQRLYETSANINKGAEREIDETTLGVTYHFTKKSRMTFNYAFRDVEAPTDYDTATGIGAAAATRFTNNANIVTDSIGDRVGLQLTYIF